MRSRHRVTLQKLAWTIATFWCTANSVSYAFLKPSCPRTSHAAAPRSRCSFSNVGAVKAEEPLSEVKPSLDPSDICSNNDSSLATPLSGVQLSQSGSQPQKEQHDGKVGIWAARGILLMVAALWGTNFASVKYMENLCFEGACNHLPSESALARFGVAALVSTHLLLKQRRDVILGGLECGMWISLGYVAQAMALTTIPAGKCAFICSLTVVFVPFVSALFHGRPIKIMNIIAAAVALTGVGVLEGLVDVNSLLGIHPADIGMAPSMTVAVSSPTALVAPGPVDALAQYLGVGRGDLLALGQPIGFGYSFLRIEHYQEKFKDVPSRILTIAAAQCVAVGLISFFWVLVDYHGTMPDLSYMIEPHHLAAIGWTGIVTTVFAIFLEGIALQTATATDASITFSTEPVWASLFGFSLLREQLNVNSYIGGAIILTACFVAALSDLRADRKSEAEVEVTSEYQP